MIARIILGCLVMLFVASAPRGADAQPYCAMYYDDTRTCGIPTLQECEQSISGVGGNCMVDDTAGTPQGRTLQGPLQRLLEQRQLDNKPSSPELDDVPPPPGN